MSTALDWLKQQRRRPVPTRPSGDDAAVIGSSISARATPVDAMASDSWQEVFDTLRRLRERGPRKAPTASRPQGWTVDRDLKGEEIAPGLWRHVEHRKTPFAEGLLDLGALAQPSPGARRRGATPLPERIEASRLVFFDTETTGLAGGTGTRAFMVGLARFSDEGLRITQLTTATMAAEADMLHAVVAALGEESVLVSYNGKSYDRPLLGTRLRLARIDDPLAGLPHLDLLHPTRRRLRHRLPDCRLATVERKWLGVVRDHDLPGSEAPAAWLDYLRGGSAALLRRVGEHNAQDLASLATLLLRHLEAEATGRGVAPSIT